MSADATPLARQLSYFRERTHALAARLFQADRQTSLLRHELEQKRRGFALLARLSAELRPVDADQALHQVASQLGAALAMPRTLVLQPDGDGRFSVRLAYGYPAEQRAALLASPLDLPTALLDPLRPVCLNDDTGPEDMLRLAERLMLPFFVSAVVEVEHRVAAVLLGGRLKALPPFQPRLEEGDVETVQAIAGLLGAVLAQQRLREVSHMAHYDALTGLPNKRLALERLQQALWLGQRSGAVTALLFIDLDGFKAVNDQLGHDAGDELLCLLAGRLQGSVRLGDTAARLGGDEFIVLMPELDTPEPAVQMARRILAAVQQPLAIQGRDVVVGASIGIACSPAHGQTPGELLKAADRAMYEVKNRYKNGYALAG